MCDIFGSGVKLFGTLVNNQRGSSSRFLPCSMKPGLGEIRELAQRHAPTLHSSGLARHGNAECHLRAMGKAIYKGFACIYSISEVYGEGLGYKIFSPVIN